MRPALASRLETVFDQVQSNVTRYKVLTTTVRDDVTGWQRDDGY
jgi:hypothetical protein